MDMTPNLKNDVTDDDDVKIMSDGIIEVTKDNKHVVDVPELMVRKMMKLSLQYIVSPFMAEAKRRMSVDGMLPSFMTST